MAETLTLKVESREKRKHGCRDLRNEEFVPGIVYGHGKDPQMIKVPYLAFERIYAKAGENTIVDLELDGKSEKVLIYDTDVHPVSDRYHHVDFYRVDMTKTIDTEIPLKLVGQSPCVVVEGGMLVQSLDQVEVRCLPGDLIQEIEVDISVLENFSDSIHVSDLNIPETLQLMTSEKILVAQVIEPKEEEIPTEAPEGPATEGGTAEGEAAAPSEGEAAAPAEGGEEKKEG